MKTNLLVDPNTWYQEQLLEIGHILQTNRQNQGHSLELMSNRTLIRASLLAAIEQGDYHSVPQPVYLRGLIRRYGESLGLDGETLAAQLFIPTTPQSAQGKAFSSAQLRPLHLYATYIVILVAAISGLSYVLRRNSPELSALPPLDPFNQSQVQASSRVAASIPKAELTAPDSPIEVEMTLTSPSWLRIVTDGTTEFEGILQPGDTRLVQAKKILTIRAGNAGGVMVSYNNSPVTPLGKPGMVEEVTYSPDSLEKAKMVSLVY
jgi:cytoskeletal protein RodZ